MTAHPAALDTQCFTYILNVMANPIEPKGDLAEEKIALLRSFLYLPFGLYITDTAISECKIIPNDALRELHESFIGHPIEDLHIQNKAWVDTRIIELMHNHPCENDCRILAEAESLNLTHVLSYDKTFVKRLAKNSQFVTLQYPSVYWNNFDIQRGAIPITQPRDSNPLSKQSWWRW